MNDHEMNGPGIIYDHVCDSACWSQLSTKATHLFRFDSGRLPDFRCHSRLERAGKVNISGSWRHVSISGMFSVLQERQIKTEPLGALQMMNCAKDV